MMSILDRLKATIYKAVGKRSLERPATPLADPDDWLVDALGGGRSAAGIRVNRDAALTYAAVWRAVNLISRDVAKLPLLVYRRVAAGGRDRASAHPAYRLLRRKPNADMTAFCFKQTLQAHALLTGNGYAYIMRNGNAAPRELLPLGPEITYPVREGGKLLYITHVNDEPRKLRAEDVLHIRGLGYDGLVGYSVIGYAAESLGLGLAARQYGARFYRNNARPSVVIQHPEQITPEAAKNLRESWDRLYSGLDNSHRTAVLEEGMKVQQLSVSARDSQLLESRQFEIREVANWFGVPPHKVGDTTRTAFASLEQENQQYLDEALDGWLVNWEQECTDKLLTEEQKRSDSHYCEFVRAALVRADLKSRFEAYNLGLMGGWMNRDEVRERENLNPMPDGAGQQFYVPMNMGLAGEEDRPTDLEEGKSA